jgi:molybdopterin converting factor subunit 1
MRIELLFFAQVREALGRDRESLEIEEGNTIEDVLTLLRQRPGWPSVDSLPLRYAVNERIVEPEHVLSDGERVALLTPVSGG